MKFKSKKSIAGLIGFSALGLATVVVLPLTLTSCGSTTSGTPSTPIPQQPEKPEANPPQQTPPTASNITVAIQETKQNDGSISLQALATDKNSNVTTFGYQWYYKQKPNQFYNSFTTLTSSANNSTDGWTILNDSTNQTLNIAAKYVVPGLSNYDFMCVAYNANNQKESCLSNPINIPNIAPKEISISESAINNLITNFTNKLTIKNIQDMVEGQVTGVNQWVTCSPTLTDVICQNLFGQSANDLVNPLQSIQISLGQNWYDDEYGFTQNVSLNVKIIFNEGNYNLNQNNSNQEQTMTFNNKVTLVSQGNVITVSHLQTAIKIADIKDSKTGQFEPIMQAIQAAGLQSSTGVIALSDATLPIYQAFATYLGVPLAAIEKVDITLGSLTDNNTQYVSVYVNGYDVSNLYNDYGSGNCSDCQMIPNGHNLVEFELKLSSGSN